MIELATAALGTKLLDNIRMQKRRERERDKRKETSDVMWLLRRERERTGIKLAGSVIKRGRHCEGRIEEKREKG